MEAGVRNKQTDKKTYFNVPITKLIRSMQGNWRELT